MNRGLDGIYFRIQRDGVWQNICFSDLTDEERDNVMCSMTTEMLRRMCKMLGNTIKSIGDELNLVREE